MAHTQNVKNILFKGEEKNPQEDIFKNAFRKGGT